MTSRDLVVAFTSCVALGLVLGVVLGSAAGMLLRVMGA